MEIDFQDHTSSVNERKIDLIRKLLTFAAKEEKVSSEAEISITFVDNNEIQEINSIHRQKNAPTDVISFALQDSVEGEIEIVGENIPEALGDIIISIDKAKEQADEYGHSIERELGFLALHGFLHLLGYDHIEANDEKKMFSRQEEILHAYGLPR